MKNDCIECTNRKVGCHATCEKYREFRKNKDYENNMRRMVIQKWKDGHYK